MYSKSSLKIPTMDHLENINDIALRQTGSSSIFQIFSLRYYLISAKSHFYLQHMKNPVGPRTFHQITDITQLMNVSRDQVHIIQLIITAIIITEDSCDG